jgi:cytochrome c553
MKLVASAFIGAFGAAVIAQSAQSSPPVPPPWAYTVNTPPAPGETPAPRPPVDTSAKQMPGSTASFTAAQTRDAYAIADWHPDGHAALPDVVAHGRRPALRACGFCHLPNGQGRPENAALAGLPAAYILQQMADFKGGLRKSAEPKMGPPAAMIVDAKAATDDEARLAAEYFAATPFKKWIRVVEARDVPVTRVAASMHQPFGTGTEPLGQRIIEMAEDLSRTELRDDASGFVAYVPAGSIAKGRALVSTGGGGKTPPCGVCHGADLRGLGPVPPLAGRSPSYIVRQLFDMQTGARHGLWSPLMKSSVEKLTIDDLIAIAAYLASIDPAGSASPRDPS